jgi:SAM-dependent methyltransferase
VIAKEPPSAEIESRKGQPPVKQPDADRIENVRTLFDQGAAYLDRRQLDIRLRRETVDRVVQGKPYTEILDIGCGDGSISRPLLNSKCRLTLLDVSPGMLSMARSRVPEELSSRAKFVNQDFMQVPFEKNFFDLVICVGVLAHVVSPQDLIVQDRVRSETRRNINSGMHQRAFAGSRQPAAQSFGLAVSPAQIQNEYSLRHRHTESGSESRVQAGWRISLRLAAAWHTQILFRRRRVHDYPVIVRGYRSQSQSMVGHPAHFSFRSQLNSGNRNPLTSND